MFLASCVVMAPAYLLLSLPTTFWGFLATYFLVAVGHGMFKPVVISTVAKTTTEEEAREFSDLGIARELASKTAGGRKIIKRKRKKSGGYFRVG